MADVLSQSEVDSLLAALDPETGSAGSGSASASRAADRLNSQVSIYDFKRPERVSKEQMRAFQALHEGFSREFGASLSGMLRTIVEVKLLSVDQLTYSEFIFSLENPTCFNLLHSEGLGGHLVLDLNPSIIYPIVDRLLGGGKEPGQARPLRPLTEIELRLVSRITSLVIRGLDNVWSNICDLKLSVTQTESNPQLAQIVPPNEVIVLIGFEITMGESRGVMNLCIPFNTIEPLAGKLSSDSWSTYSKRVADSRQQLNLETSLSQAGVEMVVQLAKSNLTAGELRKLAVGDVIMTDKESNQEVEVFFEGRQLFKGTAGSCKGHKAVQIASAVSRPQDLVESELKQRDASKQE